MKKILFLISTAFILFTTSCKNESSTSTTKEPSKNEAAVKEVYKAMETGDMSKLDSLIANDCVDHNGGPMGHEMKGRDSIKRMFAAMHSSVPDLKMETKEMSSEGDYVFSWMHMTGTSGANPDPMMGMPANTKMDMTGVDIIKFNSDGKATDHWGYMDPNDMMKMMPPGGMAPGGMNAPPPAAMTDTSRGKMGGKMMDTTKKKK
jgi:steroid delta-isomerase-like uncharacterized protein